MNISLSEHFTYKKLFLFTLPSIAMMIFTSIYGIVDGLFVSNTVGETAFTAVNFIMPVLMIIGSAGFMFGAGGSALVSKTLGEGDNAKANRIFSLIVYTSFAVGVIFAVIVLPLFFKTDGIFMSVAVAELAACALTAAFLIAKKKKYGY